MDTPRIMLLQTLAAWPAPGPPQCTMRLPMTSKMAAGRGKVLLGAAHHERQGAGLGPHNTAGNRRVQAPVPAGHHHLVGCAGVLDRDGGALQEQRPGLGRGQQTAAGALPLKGGKDVLSGGQHGDDDIGPARCRGGGGGHHHPGRGAASSAAGTTSKPVTG